jgi:hypothetical protein
MFFTLECGRKVSVDACYFQATYLSLLEGRPNARMNREIIEQAKAEMRSLWGDRQVHVIPPAIDESDPSHPQLPPIRFTAWLHCYQPVKPGNAGSELVVVWFRSKCDDQSLVQVIGDGIHHLAWEKLARDFAAY